jgi:pseudouridine synthase
VVTDFFPSTPRLFPVGRLDFMTSGLLILTNDGAFMNHMIHPRHEVDKVYQVLVKGQPEKAKFRKLESGIDLDGKVTKMALVKNIVPKGNNCQFNLTIQEGRNRQVRRMCQAIGHPVIGLKRVRMGPLTLKGLRPGQYRPLTQKELNQIFQRRP